jgi:hypothetical protein
MTLPFQNVMQRMVKVNSPQNTVQLLVYDTRTTAPRETLNVVIYQCGLQWIP